MTNPVVKAYLDNDIVSAIARNDKPDQSDALDRLLAAYEERRVDLVTSELTHQEIKNYKGNMRSPIERIFRLLAKVSIIRWDELIGINSQIDAKTVINSPMIHNDPIYDKLLRMGVKTVDAQHMFMATKSACGFFLTCDKGILSRSSAIGKLCGVTAQKPSDFVESQGW